MTVNFSHIRWLSFYKFFNPNYISKRCSESLILSEILFGCHGMAPHFLSLCLKELKVGTLLLCPSAARSPRCYQ